MGLFNRLLERKPKAKPQVTEEIPQIADKDMEELVAPENETAVQKIQREWNEYSEAQRQEAMQVYERSAEIMQELTHLETAKNAFFKFFDRKYQGLKKELAQLNEKIAEIQPVIAAYHAKKTYEQDTVQRVQNKRGFEAGLIPEEKAFFAGESPQYAQMSTAGLLNEEVKTRQELQRQSYAGEIVIHLPEKNKQQVAALRDQEALIQAELTKRHAAEFKDLASGKPADGDYAHYSLDQLLTERKYLQTKLDQIIPPLDIVLWLSKAKRQEADKLKAEIAKIDMQLDALAANETAQESKAEANQKQTDVVHNQEWTEPPVRKAWSLRRYLKPAVVVGTAAAVLGFIVEKGIAFADNLEEVKVKTHELVKDSSIPQIDKAPLDVQETGLIKAAEDQIDMSFTQFVREKGYFSTFSKLCSQKLVDGTLGLDADKCYDIFGNQLSFDRTDIVDSIAAPEGLTGKELVLRGKILRGSIIADTDEMMSFGSGLKVPFYLESGSIPGNYQPDKNSFYQQEYESMQNLAEMIVTETHLADQDAKTQKEIITTAKRALKKQLQLDIRWLAVGSDIENQEKKLSFLDLSEGIPDPGHPEQDAVSQIEKLQKMTSSAEKAYQALDAYLDASGSGTKLSDLFISAELEKQNACWQLAGANGQHEEFWKAQLADVAEQQDTGAEDTNSIN